MKQKLKNLLLVAFFFAGFGNAFAQTATIKQVKLKNGLTVILNEDHSKTEVFGMVIVNAGSKNDPSDATGMAHYQEHMLFKGTTELGTSNWEKEKPHIDRIIELYDELGKTKEPNLRTEIQQKINKESIEAGKYTILNELSTLVDKMGGTNLNAGTGDDQTFYYNSFPPNQIERWVELYSHRFIDPVFRAFQAELETVYEEKNMYNDNFITGLLESFNKNFYKNHPYGQQTTIGTTEHLKNPSLSKMYDFFHTHYVPNNMAVLLIGDFDSEKVLPLLKEKFGRWESKKLPQKKQYKEQAFKGREEFVGKFSPIKMAVLGFRTVPIGHPDELALAIFNKLLNNDSGTGALNKLVQNGKIMASEAIEMHKQDYGADMYLVIPKIIGQKLRTAEDLVLNTIYKMRDGEFEENAIEQIKKEMYVDFQLGLEDFETRGYSLANYFMRSKDCNNLFQYPKQINAISKEDVMHVAKKYYGNNYLAFYSKRGSQKKEKLTKPNYDPVTTDKKAVSAFAKHYGALENKLREVKCVDFKNDIQELSIANGVQLYAVKNPINDIYTATISFRVGKLKIKEAGYVANLLNTAGTKDMSRDQLQNAFAQIGSSYACSGNNESVEIELTGVESGMEKAIKLAGELIANPVITEDDLATTADNVISERKIERDDLSNVASALVGFVAYGDKSKNIFRMSKKEIKNFTSANFNSLWSTIKQYSCNIHYTGKMNSKEVGEIIASKINFSKKPLPEDFNIVPPMKNYKKDIIYFVNKKDAVQANIFFLVNGNKFDKEKVLARDAFNSYFGGGFSGVVLQEIREYRSLAYSASATYMAPERANEDNYFIGMIGTQADKTIDAINVFYGLKKDMPKMPERMSFIQPYLSQQAITAYPNFRYLSTTVQEWKKLGYAQDPSVDINKKVEELTFDTIYEFYKNNIQSKPMVTMVVGDKSKIDMKRLSTLGEVKVIKESKLFTK